MIMTRDGALSHAISLMSPRGSPHGLSPARAFSGSVRSDYHSHWAISVLGGRSGLRSGVVPGSRVRLHLLAGFFLSFLMNEGRWSV